MDEFIATAFVGIGATALVDAWSLLRRRLFGVPAPDFGLVGRWLAFLPRGHFRHAAITAAAPVPGERVLGWTAHYAIGVSFAALLVGFAGSEWLRQPRLGVALVVGVVTVAAPFLLLQPGMGAGLAGRLTKSPAATRLHSLLTHAIFGLGLYLSALALNALPGTH